ncbi:hypothetical protein IPM19_03800 [bacterium]|nr:MAG: hypothetical protein IPM19_03800 [bacterium]
MHKIVFYDVSKDERALISKYVKKLEVEIHSSSLSRNNFPSAHTEVLSVHVDSKVTADTIKRLPNLKLIITRTAGFDHIDLKAATSAGVMVANCAGQNAISVAEYVFGLIMNNFRNFPAAFKKGRDLKFGFETYNGRELYGKTIGIIGTGSIGAHVAAIASGFGMKVLGYDERKNQDLVKRGVLRYVSLDKLVSSSDIISLHVPALKSTIKMVNGKFLAKAKAGLLLVNTSRGAVVDTSAVVKALESGRLGGFVSDVLELEAKPSVLHALSGSNSGSMADSRQIWALQKKLVKMPNVLLTPHTAHATKEATERILARTFEIIGQFRKGQKISCVN